MDAPQDLRAFIDLLRREGEVIEIDAPVNAELEAAEIHRRVIAAGGPALLFRNVEGASFPLVTNLFGTARRVELAFGSRPGEVVAEAARLPEEMVPPSLGKLWSKRGLFGRLAKVGMKRSRQGSVTEVVDAPPALERLPALKTWIRDGGRFVTLPLVYTEHPETGGHNLGMYRAQLFEDTNAGPVSFGPSYAVNCGEADTFLIPINSDYLVRVYFPFGTDDQVLVDWEMTVSR